MNDQPPSADPPAWHGTPRDELPLRLIRGLDLLVNLEGRRGFPAGEILSETLNRGTVGLIRGATIKLNEQGDTSVTLWVPAFDDQKTGAIDNAEPTEHVPLPETERWQVAELALAALGATMSDSIIHFGFLTTDSSFALPWHEYCRHYPHPPEFAIGFWTNDEG